MTERYAEKSRYALNPDEVTVRHVQEGLAKNKAKYGRGYCPCRPVEGDPKIDVVNICPCRSHEADIAENGTCECGIFVSKKFLEDFRCRALR